MAGRGNFEAALQSVQRFEAAEVEERQTADRKRERDADGGRSHKKHKHRRHERGGGDKGSRKRDKEGKERKEKHKRKEEKRRKDKKPAKRARQGSSGDSESGSGSDSGASSDDRRGDPRRWSGNTRLQRGRAAVQATRDLMAYHAGIQSELRELLRQLDSGEAVDISGVQEAALQNRLGTLFWNLPLMRNKMAFRKMSGSESILGTLGLVLQETVQPKVEEPAASEGPKGAAQGVKPEKPGGAEPMGAAPAGGEDEDEWVAEPDDPDEVVALGAKGEATAEAAAEGGPAASIGPAMPPGQAVPAPAVDEEEEEAEEVGPAPKGPSVGPAMPSQEMLAAAAAAAAAQDWAEEEEEEEEEWDLIGPVPPEIMLDLEGAGDDARAMEVVRVIKALAEAAQAGTQPDAYHVLGAEPSMSKTEVKKKYWKLSLLIHPDKCEHPKAQAAFAAVNEAAKTLQDEAGRKQLDARREDERLMKIAAEVAREQERAAEWARLRGEPMPEGYVPPQEKETRGTWMTELPPEKQVKAGISLDNMVTSFSQKEQTGRGDTSAWTDTPESRAERLRLGGPSALALPSARGAAEAKRTSAVASMVDSYNTQKRAKSLLEQHMENQEKEKRERKEKRRREKAKAKGKDKDTGKGKGTAGMPDDEGEDWEGKHPWRPFDREKDLGTSGSLKPKSAKEIMEKSGSLGSRFGASGGRAFL
eukprot:jgi/Tetstr1/437888/TSEL_002841.t1